VAFLLREKNASQGAKKMSVLHEQTEKIIERVERGIGIVKRGNSDGHIMSQTINLMISDLLLRAEYRLQKQIDELKEK